MPSVVMDENGTKNQHRLPLALLLAMLVVVGCAGSRPQLDAIATAKPPQLRLLPPVPDAPTDRDWAMVGNESAGQIRQVAYQEEIESVPADVLFAGPTTVEELVAYATANNPKIAAARSRAEAQISRVVQARSLDDPQLSATAFLEQIQTAGGPQDVIVSLSQKFPWFGKRNARGEIAFHDAQVAFAEMADMELAVIERVKLAYYDLYFLNEAIAVYQDLEPKIQDVIVTTRTLYETNAREVGLESVYQAEITLHKLQITLAELEQARLKVNARLAEALHLPEGLKLDIEPQLGETTRPQQVDALVALIDHVHPKLEARRQAIVRDDWAAALARKDYYPDVNIGFNWYAIGDQGLSAVANGRDAYSLMAGINMPIYRAKRNAAVREAQFRLAKSDEEYEAVWDALRADVTRVHADVVEQDRVLAILNDDILRKSQDTFELSIAAYRVGRIGFQQLIDNYESLLKFSIDRHSRQARREQAIAQLERASGSALLEAPAVIQ